MPHNLRHSDLIVMSNLMQLYAFAASPSRKRIIKVSHYLLLRLSDSLATINTSFRCKWNMLGGKGDVFPCSTDNFFITCRV